MLLATDPISLAIEQDLIRRTTRFVEQRRRRTVSDLAHIWGVTVKWREKADDGPAPLIEIIEADQEVDDAE